MKKAYLLAAISIFFWSTIAVMAKILLRELDNIQVLWASSAFAAAFLFILNAVSGNLKKLKRYKIKDVLISVLIGLPGTFFYYVFYYAGTDMMLASQAFIVNYLWPIMCVVFACIITKEKITARKGIAIFVSFLGVCVVTGGDIMHVNRDTLFGAAFCICGAVSYGLFSALNQKFKYDKKLSMMINFITTFILTTIINACGGKLFVPDILQTLGFAWNGVFSMGIATTTWALALECGNTAKISNLAYITPFLSLVWTFFVLHEPISIFSVVGLVIIVLGIFIQLREKSNM